MSRQMPAASAGSGSLPCAPGARRSGRRAGHTRPPAAAGHGLAECIRLWHCRVTEHVLLSPGQLIQPGLNRWAAAFVGISSDRTIVAAIAARQAAYAPYSGFHVGAAVRGESGAVYVDEHVAADSSHLHAGPRRRDPSITFRCSPQFGSELGPGRSSHSRKNASISAVDANEPARC